MSILSRLLALIALAAVVFLVASCTPVMPVGEQPMGGMDAPQAMPPLPTPEPGKLAVVDVRARPAPLEGGNGAAFLTVLNGLDAPVRLLSAAGDVAATIELHETINVDGVMKMEPHPEGFEIAASDVLVLQPGGKHVMLLGLVQPLAPGDSFDLTLNFEGSDPITVTVPVMEMTGMPAMDMP
jgi:copper(I)-binding protein